jgi:microcin C transport system permease protein
MRDYILRRMLLVPLTFLGITLVAFLLTRFVPGGPIERALAEKLQASQKHTGLTGLSSTGPASPEELDNLKRQYGFDRPILEAYGIWLGALPGPASWGIPRLDSDEKGAVEISNPNSNKKENVRLSISVDSQKKLLIKFADGTIAKEWVAELAPLPMDPNPATRVVVYSPKFSGILQGNLGTSAESDRSVSSLLWEKIPLSAWFGFWSILIAYLVAVPLGVYKALNNGSIGDGITSALVFFGFAIPGFVLALGSMYLICFHLNWLPHSGFNWNEPIRHTILPLACESAGAFATMTLFMKNSLLDNLNADYIRTARAKGASPNRVVYIHALRNSIIPLAANFGNNLSFFLTGAFLIEYTFDIDGLGLLGYDSLVHRDFPVFLGLLTVSSITLLIGNIISDLCLAAVDPRIRFHK